MTNILILPSLQRLIDSGIVPSNYGASAYGGESAGLDLYYCGDEPFYLSDYEETQNRLMPVGIRVAIPEGYVGLITERGSVIKTPLKIRAGVIDHGFTSEIFINCVLINSSEYCVLPGMKLPFQLIVVPFLSFQTVTAEIYDAVTIKAKRKSGSLGSSDILVKAQVQ